MKKTEKAILIEGLRKLSADAAAIADALDGKTVEAPATEPEAKPEPVSTEVPATEEKTYTFEEVRGIMADKARAGYKAEVKAILTAHGVEKLSQITDPDELNKVAKEAKEVGADG